MPLTDAFSLTPVTIDVIDGAQTHQRLQASPDDVNGRGILVTFVNCDQTADLTGQKVYFGWRCEATGWKGVSECDEDYAPGGRFKVKYPKGMLVPNTVVQARFVVPQRDGDLDDAYSSRIFDIEVGESLMGDPYEGENEFTLFTEALVELNKGKVDLSEWNAMAEEAVQDAELAVNKANAATRETLENEAERQQAFTDSQTENQRTFDDALEQMKGDHEAEERAHREAFDSAQTQRQGTFDTNERTRQTTFESGEETRRQTFDTAEAERQREHEEEEAAHAKAFEDAELARDAAVDEAVSEAEAAAERADASAKGADTSAAGADSSAQIAYQAAQDADAARGELESFEADIEAAEETRAQAEQARVESQAANDAAQVKNNADQAANNLAAQGFQRVFLVGDQYDPDTLTPTVDGEMGVIYCVPRTDPVEDDEYVEWMWVYKSDGAGKWERIGGSNAVLPDAITTGQIDEVVDEGATLQGNQILGAPGLSYYDAKSKARDAALYDAKGSAETAKSDAIDAATQALADAVRDQEATDQAQDEAMVEAMAAIGRAQQGVTDLGGTLTGHISEQETRDSDQDDAIASAKQAGVDAAGQVSQALDAYKGTQETRDTGQDEAIREAKEAAEAAAKAIPPTVTSEAPGILPPYPAEGGPYYPSVKDGVLAWKEIPVVSTDGPGLMPTLSGNKYEFLNGVKQWTEVESGGGGADPSELRALIAEATKMHDEAWTGSQSDPLLHSWKNTSEAIAALQVAVDAAKAVEAEFWKTIFKQRPLDEARDALQEAIDAFKATGTEVLPNLETFESLKSRVSAVDGSATESADGKDVTFGERYVLTADKRAAKSAVDTAQSAVDSATKQSQIDSACSTLTSAVTKYEGQVKTATKSTTAVDAAIAAANEAKDGVQVSEDGSDLPAGSRYVEDQATLDAIEQAIQTATDAKESATNQRQIDDATSALTKATTEFGSKVKQNISIYGVSFANFPTTTKGTRTDGAADFGDPKPASNNGSGSSPFDSIAPWSEMKAEDRAGGRMVKISKFYYKLTQNGKGVNVQIATGPMEGFKICPACMDRNDGKGEREAVYVGRYHCATGTYKSTTKVNPAASATKANMYTSCHNVGGDYYMMDFATRFTIWLLYLVEFAEWNSQKAIGGGCSTSKAIMQMGYTDNMQYCTGTTAASIGATVYGGTQYRNIEGLWDNVYDFMSGCYNDGNGFNLVTDKAKLNDTSGGKSVGTPANGWVGELKVSETGGYPIFYNANTSGGSDSAGTCDYWYFGSGNPVVCVGGNYNQYSNLGMFCVSYASASSSGANFGCRLLELP